MAGGRGRTRARVALAVWLLPSLAAAVVSAPGRGDSLSLRLGAGLSDAWSALDAGVNVSLFLVPGFLARPARVGVDAWWRLAAAATVLSAGIEVAQRLGSAGTCRT